MNNDKNTFNLRIQSLNQLLCEHIRELLDDLGIRYIWQGEYISMQCYYHGGGSPRGVTININEFGDYYATWKCWSKNCQKKLGHSILGLLRGLLSVQQGRLPTKQFVVNYALKFLGIKSLNDIPIEDIQRVKKKNYCAVPVILVWISIANLYKNLVNSGLGKRSKFHLNIL